MTSYAGKDLAPYWRLRPTGFYGGFFMNGTYTADIHGCNWTCENCWSKYGWHGVGVEKRPAKGGGGEFTSVEIADKLIAGMKRNAQPICRISGGEASMYWEPHMVNVIREVITRTQGMRMHVEGATPPDGDVMGILIETHGGVITKQQLMALEDEFDDEAGRIVIAMGIKATSPELLAKLTGMTLKTCERFHQRQMDNLKWLAHRSTSLGWFGNFLEPFTDPVAFAELQRKTERETPGAGRLLGLLSYSTGYDSSRHFTPKRFRTPGEEFNEPGAVVDEEVIITTPEEQLPLAPVSDAPVTPSEKVEQMRDLERATAHLPEGQVK